MDERVHFFDDAFERRFVLLRSLDRLKRIKECLEWLWLLRIGFWCWHLWFFLSLLIVSVRGSNVDEPTYPHSDSCF